MFKFVIAITMALFVSSDRAHEGSQVSSSAASDSQFRVSTPDQAVARALKITGFDQLKSIDTLAAVSSAKLITMFDSTTPFLADSINGDTVWRIEFKDVVLGLKDVPAELAEQHPRHFVVYLSPSPGGLIRVSSRSEERSAGLWNKPLAQDAERLMSSNERYIGFPEHDPAVTFSEALGAAKGDPLIADEIDAVLVMYTYSNKLPHREITFPCPVWAIHLYGIPTVQSTKYPDLPRSQTGHLRTIVDAVNGQWLHAGNSP